MTPQQFSDLAAQGFNRIPVVREVLADLDTPLSAYLKLANKPFSYLFESMQGGEKWGRYSIIGLPCATRVSVQQNLVTLVTNDEIVEQITTADPLAWISEFQQRFKIAQCAGLPRFSGGLVGYFGYDTIKYIEPKLAQHNSLDILGCPDILLMVSDEVVIFDNLAGRLYIIINADPTQGATLAKTEERIDDLIASLRKSIPNPIGLEPQIVKEQDFVASFEKQDFKAAVEKIKSYILDGDCMQVVLSQRLSIPFTAPPLDLYRALRCLNPSPYMYYIDTGELHVVGASPEILVRLDDNTITVRPIAGTRRRGHDEAEDLAMEAELLADPKEIAEHLMLIDLGRNDIGRVSQIGTVQVTDKMLIERYSHVMHIVSNVRGTLNPNFSAVDVLRATFPAGTVSGAPKIRAMEIIAELEPVKRGIYSGAIGYLAWNGNMDTAIAIRTAVIKDQVLYIQAGAGIVAESQPTLEWKETLNKARAIFKAVAMVAAGIDNHRLTS
ncbi:anthranilate synthase component I [Achromatium sp. WMS2]|nr:anthranilate synthase component I [Achromatium sp. WMS2]